MSNKPKIIDFREPYLQQQFDKFNSAKGHLYFMLVTIERSMRLCGYKQKEINLIQYRFKNQLINLKKGRKQ